MAAFVRDIFLVLLLCGTVGAAAQESTEPPPPVKAPVGVVTEEVLPRAGGIMVFGGTGPLGLEIVKSLLAQKEHVTVLARASSDTAELKALGVNIVTGDALSPESLKEAFTAAPFRAAISTLGGNRGNYQVDTDGNKNAVEAAKAAGVPRFILVTAIGAGSSNGAMPWYIRWFMKDYMAAKTVAEDHLKASELEYTVVRPGILMNEIEPGQAVLTDDVTKFSGITRADLGKLVAAAVEDKNTFRKELTAFDASRASIWSMLF